MQSLYYTVQMKSEAFPSEGKLTISYRMSKETARKCLEMTRNVYLKYFEFGQTPISLHIIDADPSYPLLTLMELEELGIQWDKEDNPPRDEGNA